MATSNFYFSSPATVSSSLTTAEATLSFTPPSNISGKLCYIQCSVWNWDFTSSPSPALTSRDAFAFECSWSNPNSGVCSKLTDGTSFTQPNTAVVGVYFNNISYDTGPILAMIPDGPQQVTFTVFRPDGGSVAGTDGPNQGQFFASLKIVPADSRQPQIGV